MEEIPGDVETSGAESKEHEFTGAEIQDVSAYFSVSDAKGELSGWLEHIRISSRGYMLGYKSLHDPCVSGFHRFFAKVGDGRETCIYFWP